MKKFLSLILVSTLAGCASIPQGTAPSATPLVSENGISRSYEVLGRGEGSAGHFTLFGFIPFGRTDIDKAIHEAVATYQGDNLINVNYNVNSIFYFIGTFTSITVKGDVIKYTGAKVTESGQPAQTNVTTSNTVSTPSIPSNHKLTLGSAIDGLAFDYTLIKPINDYLFYSFSLGYKKYVYKESQPYYWGYTYENEYKINSFPIRINIGGIVKKPFDLPVDAYASTGLAYIPLQSGNSSKYVFDQVGLNLNLGVIYKLIKNIACGVEYSYLKSFIKYKDFLEDKGLGFSNLNASVIYYP